MNASWSTIVIAIFITAFPLAANAGKKETCVMQAKLAKSAVEARLTGVSKQTLLDLNKKAAAASRATAGPHNSVVEVVYAAEENELDLVPGMIYAQCMK